MRRELRSVRTGEVLGAVDDALTPPFEGAAADVLGGLRRQLGDEQTVRTVLADGWSNGYLYFPEATT